MIQQSGLSGAEKAGDDGSWDAIIEVQCGGEGCSRVFRLVVGCGGHGPRIFMTEFVGIELEFSGNEGM